MSTTPRRCGETILTCCTSLTNGHKPLFVLWGGSTLGRGRTVLYVSQMMTRAIVGLEPDASERLLGDLFDHLEIHRSEYGPTSGGPAT